MVKRTPQKTAQPSLRHQAEEFVNAAQTEELKALGRHHDQLVKKINHPYAVLLSLGIPSLVAHLMLSPNSPLSSVVTYWYETFFQRQMKRYEDSLSWYSAQEMTVTNSIPNMKRFCDNLVNDMVAIYEKRGIAHIIEDGVLRETTTAVLASYNIETVLQILDKKLNQEKLFYYKSIFIDYLRLFLANANAVKLTLTGSTPELHAAINPDSAIGPEISLPANLLEYSLSALYEMVKRMNKRLEIYNHMREAYRPMHEEAINNALRWGAAYYGWKATYNRFLQAQVVVAVSGYFLLSERAIRHFFPQGVLQPNYLKKELSGDLNILPFDQAEQRILKLKTACIALAPVANRNNFIARILLLSTLMTVLSSYNEDISTEAWWCLTVLAGIVFGRSWQSAFEWWGDYRYEDTLEARHAEIQKMFQAFSQSVEVVYNYGEIETARMMVRFKPYQGLSSRAVAKAILSVLVANQVDMTRIASNCLLLSAHHPLPHRLILKVRGEIDAALDSAKKAQETRKQFEECQLLQNPVFGLVVRPMLAQAFLKYIQVSFLIPVEYVEAVKALFSNLEHQIQVYTKHAHVSLALFGPLPFETSKSFLTLLQEIDAERSLNQPTMINEELVIPGLRPRKKAETASAAAEVTSDSDEEQPVISIAWPSGQYRSDEAIEIVPISRGARMQRGHFAFFRCDKSQFPTDELFKAFKKVITDNPSIVPPRGRTGLKWVASTERKRDQDFFAASLKAKVLGCKYRVVAHEEISADGAHLHIFDTVVKKH